MHLLSVTENLSHTSLSCRRRSSRWRMHACIRCINGCVMANWQKPKASACASRVKFELYVYKKNGKKAGCCRRAVELWKWWTCRLPWSWTKASNTLHEHIDIYSLALYFSAVREWNKIRVTHDSLSLREFSPFSVDRRTIADLCNAIICLFHCQFQYTIRGDVCFSIGSRAVVSFVCVCCAVSEIEKMKRSWITWHAAKIDERMFRAPPRGEKKCQWTFHSLSFHSI